MLVFKSATAASAVVLGATAAMAQNAQTAYVQLDVLNGVPQHLASGFIYGMPLNYDPNQIPDSYYDGINLQYGRAGGGQLPTPCRGWAFGESEYSCRFQNMLLNYEQTRKFSASFIMLPSDLWGIDFRTEISDYAWPGDNGNWSSYDAFLDQLISDIESNGMTAGLVWDIWNEPDGSGFWGASQQQWLDLYVRTHQRIRSTSGLDSVQISGPTLAGYPSLSDTWWTNWFSQIKANNTIPDQYAWHFEGGGDPAIVGLVWNECLATYDLPAQITNINEYAELQEMTPSGYAWYIARFERLRWRGLLGIWNEPLYDNFANLLTKVDSSGSPITSYCCATDNNTNYREAAGWWIYNYYGQIQIGDIANTTQSSDGNWDVYATVPAAGDNIRMLTGSHGNTGAYYLQVSGMTSVGYPESGSVQVYFYRFNGTGTIFDPIDAPQNLGYATVEYSNNEVTIEVGVEDAYYAYAVEFVRKG